ncbi:MAG: CaiB/BaiF CoA-transferase family protein [Myxococcota bacterium]|nr:CaiB/BaiF CoA-transferase family protein [Myxococcota bacterium]
MSGPLEDIVVVDLSREAWASGAAGMLADFGARVIRVDDLSVPPRDPARDGLRADEPFDSEAELSHRIKESLALDLAQGPGRELLKTLVGCADVLITDWAASRLSEMGLDPDTLRLRWPRLIVAVGSGMGPLGPDSDLPALDELAAARSGVMPSLPEPDQPPVNAGAGQMYTLVMLALGVVTALHARHETGEGQRVDASLLGGHMYASTLTLDAFMAMRDDRLGEPRSRFEAANPMSGISYPSEDGRWVTLTMPDTERWWPAFSEIVGLDVDDERFDSHDKRCGEGRLVMMQVLEEIFVTRPAAHWRDAFNEKNLSADIIERYDYPAEDENAARNRYVIEVDHPEHGRLKSRGFPNHMSDSPATHRSVAPRPGAHTHLVLGELLGLTGEEIDGLRDSGVVELSGHA